MEKIILTCPDCGGRNYRADDSSLFGHRFNIAGVPDCPRWVRWRKKYLLDKPCERCNKPAEVLHHPVLAYARWGTDEEEPLLQPLCNSCHNHEHLNRMIWKKNGDPVDWAETMTKIENREPLGFNQSTESKPRVKYERTLVISEDPPTKEYHRPKPPGYKDS